MVNISDFRSEALGSTPSSSISLVVQRLEHSADNREIVGSNPIERIMKKKAFDNVTPPRGEMPPPTRKHKNRKKEANRKACRRPVREGDYSG